jgi:hypothetical protein
VTGAYLQPDRARTRWATALARGRRRRHQPGGTTSPDRRATLTHAMLTHLRSRLFAEGSTGTGRPTAPAASRLPMGAGGTPHACEDHAYAVAALLENPEPHDRKIRPLVGPAAVATQWPSPAQQPLVIHRADERDPSIPARKRALRPGLVGRPGSGCMGGDHGLR